MNEFAEMYTEAKGYVNQLQRIYWDASGPEQQGAWDDLQVGHSLYESLLLCHSQEAAMTILWCIKRYAQGEMGELFTRYD